MKEQDLNKFKDMVDGYNKRPEDSKKEKRKNILKVVGISVALLIVIIIAVSNFF